MVSLRLVVPLWFFLVVSPAAARSLSDEEVLDQAVAAFREGVSARGTPAEAALFRKAAAAV